MVNGLFSQQNAPLLLALGGGILSGRDLASGVGQGVQAIAPLLAQRGEQRRQMRIAEGLLSDPSIAGSLSPQARTAIAQSPELASSIARSVIANQIQANAPLTRAQQATIGLQRERFDFQRAEAQRERETQAAQRRAILSALGLDTQQGIAPVPPGTPPEAAQAALGVGGQERTFIPNERELLQAGVDIGLTQGVVDTRPRRQVGQAPLTAGLDQNTVRIARTQAATGDTSGALKTIRDAQRASVPKPSGGFEFFRGEDGQLSARPIRGGPATRLPAETAGRVALARTALRNFGTIRSAFTGRNAFSAGFAANFATSRGAVGRARRDLRLGIEAALRAATGAAAPETEVERFLDQFEPKPIDTRETRAAKLNNLENFLRNLISDITQGRGGPPTGTATGTQPRRDPTAFTGGDVPPQNQRIPGDTITTPRGRFRWTGAGWESLQ